jgi:hypothetical protein
MLRTAAGRDGGRGTWKEPARSISEGCTDGDGERDREFQPKPGAVSGNEAGLRTLTVSGVQMGTFLVAASGMFAVT